MKIKILSLIFALALFAGACSQRTCATYATIDNTDAQVEEDIEG